ncbi:thioesterase family protein [Paracoccus sp. (in: a-proteobacteria)]|uniref:thioesterase family protein n=1 Tax=Paracoccus sp. TaxID=267 RepID=UPI0026E10A6E|nr:thioesterase family protein [Paracoccus sp. (in: a-proteobacteria)]MDO5370706.1 thioesterase family protein [Paracoccus sp. (in: a-proteobacteria)]
MTIPFISPAMQVEPDWTDYNGHLNMAYYHLLFDRAVDAALVPLGLGAEVAAATGSSVFTAQAQVHYLRELHAGDRVTVETRLIAHDTKRLHYIQTMRRVGEDEPAAISENLILHVDLTTRRVAPFPPEVLARIAEAVAAHSDLPLPRQAGRRVGLRRD